VDPNEADFFFIPLYQQCLSHSGAHMGEYADWVRAYLSETWPYWNATHGGKMHLLALPDDQGACDLNTHMPEWANVTVLEHYGLSTPKENSGNKLMTPLPCYTPGKDVVLPPPLGSRLGATWDLTYDMFNKVRARAGSTPFPLIGKPHLSIAAATGWL